MQFEMKMPDLATTDSAIRIGRWIVEPGQPVKRGQAIVEVETDKAAMEVESVVNGRLVEIRAQVDEEVSVGEVIAVFEVDDVARPAATSPAAPSTQAAVPAAPSAAAPSAAPPSIASPSGGAGGMFARNRATSPASAAVDYPLTLAQRTAARRLSESKQSIPHFYLQTSVNAASMIARRKAAEPVKLAWDAFFVRAAAVAMKQFDRFACRLEGDRLVPLAVDAIGVAIDLERELYVVPVAQPAEKTVEQISADIRSGVERLRAGDADVRRNQPARLTVTNLGVCNVEAFIPIINPPETAILGVGRIKATPVARDDGTIAVESRCTLTLSVDHRVTAGRYAAEFLETIVRELESP